MEYHLKACTKCGGDLYLEVDDKAWACVQCAERYYADPPNELLHGRNCAQYEKQSRKVKA